MMKRIFLALACTLTLSACGSEGDLGDACETDADCGDGAVCRDEGVATACIPAECDG